MFDVLTYGFISTFGKICYPFEVLDIICVVIDIKVVCFINLPIECFVQDFVFSVIGEIGKLGETKSGPHK
jgi:hypothetical protein